MSKYAPSLYEGDNHYITPNIMNDDYINFILDICKKESIDGIFSLIDPELKILGENKHLFTDEGIMLLQSSVDLINVSFDKYKFYTTLIEEGFNTQKSYIELYKVLTDINEGKLMFPLFVKPNLGSASFNINKINNIESLKSMFEKHNDLIVQEFIDGQEYGIDVYVDFISKEVISIFIKEKMKMRAGETDKSIAVKDKKLTQVIKNFVENLGYVGQIDIDVFKKAGEYYISEVNPRFGGGYPHAYEAGCNFPRYILNNLKGKVNKSEVDNYSEGTIMMKYSDVKFLK